MFGGTWSKWAKVCTTSVADVPKTQIVFDTNTSYVQASTNYNYYEVKGGVCYVSIYVRCNTPVNNTWSLINSSLPKPEINNYEILGAWENATDTLRCVINDKGFISVRDGTANGTYLSTFSYPVAES